MNALLHLDPIDLSAQRSPASLVSDAREIASQLRLVTDRCRRRAITYDAFRVEVSRLWALAGPAESVVRELLAGADTIAHRFATELLHPAPVPPCGGAVTSSAASGPREPRDWHARRFALGDRRDVSAAELWSRWEDVPPDVAVLLVGESTDVDVDGRTLVLTREK